MSIITRIYSAQQNKNNISSTAIYSVFCDRNLCLITIFKRFNFFYSIHLFKTFLFCFVIVLGHHTLKA